MKIGGIKGGPVRPASLRKTARSKTSSTKSIASMRSDELVDVSDHSQTLDLIREMVDATPDVRVDEVDRIVRELKGGKYRIDFEKVADGFIKEAILNEMAKRQGEGR